MFIRTKTVFILPSGLFDFNTLPMGLANAAATCQRAMQIILKDLIPSCCLVYLDDVVVFGSTQAELLDSPKKTLTRYQEAGLTLNPKKCRFLQREINFLGHVISEEGISTDPKKVEVVTEWPTPTTAEEVRSFLGLTGYYRQYIPAYAMVNFPFTRITENGRKFEWTQRCEHAFESLKSALTAAPVLAFPNDNPDAPPFILDTDAINHTIWAVLTQRDANGRESRKAYGSRTLDKAERNYSTTRREWLALISFTKKFAVYVRGKCSR